jgi:hypothetical protein
MSNQQSSTILADSQPHLVTVIVTANITAAADQVKRLLCYENGQQRTQQAFICRAPCLKLHHTTTINCSFAPTSSTLTLPPDALQSHKHDFQLTNIDV